jgi:cell division protease FtsH
LIDLAYSTTKELLVEKRDKLDILAKELLKREIIYQHDLEELIGKRPFEKETSYQEFLNKKDEEPAEVSQEEKSEEKEESQAS